MARARSRSVDVPAWPLAAVDEDVAGGSVPGTPRRVVLDCAAQPKAVPSTPAGQPSALRVAIAARAAVAQASIDAAGTVVLAPRPLTVVAPSAVSAGRDAVMQAMLNHAFCIMASPFELELFVHFDENRPLVGLENPKRAELCNFWMASVPAAPPTSKADLDLFEVAMAELRELPPYFELFGCALYVPSTLKDGDSTWGAAWVRKKGHMVCRICVGPKLLTKGHCLSPVHVDSLKAAWSANSNRVLLPELCAFALRTAMRYWQANREVILLVNELRSLMVEDLRAGALSPAVFEGYLAQLPGQQGRQLLGLLLDVRPEVP
jgi:hypothetical protein